MNRLPLLAVVATALLSCSKTAPPPPSEPSTTAVERESGSAPGEEPGAPRNRTVRFTYETVVKDIPAGTKELQVWIPAPQTGSPLQEVMEQDLELPEDLEAEVSNHVSANGLNRWWHVRVPQPAADVKIVATMTVRRQEHINNYFRGAGATPISPEDRERLREELGPYDLVPIGGRFDGLASTVAKDEKNLVNIARKIYDHVLDHMRYSKEGTGWGRGDSAWACDAAYGNCTDFHSLFMSMAKSRGIPARFHMGFPLPEERGSGAVGGYHCWAEFYIPDLGWVPVDISEADKHPELAQYYFGALTEDRIGFMTGRDLELEPAPASGRRNIFIYPLAEADGKEIRADRTFSYKDA